jgi:hypothetical protein
MFIGIPLNFRNTHCIKEAVNTFGEFHYWYHYDTELTRSMVYATFPSPALVPRDVVFRQPEVGRHCGIRHSWTAPCFVLSGDFADVHPPDEDPMPLNGNPHPLPGQLVQEDYLFVLPEYPQLGWDMPPPLPFDGNMNNNEAFNKNAPQNQPQQPAGSDQLSEVSLASLSVNGLNFQVPPAAV